MKAVKKVTSKKTGPWRDANRYVTPATKKFAGYGDYVTSQYNKNTNRGRTRS